jgi:hypothetical protein
MRGRVHEIQPPRDIGKGCPVSQARAKVFPNVARTKQPGVAQNGGNIVVAGKDPEALGAAVNGVLRAEAMQ